MIIGAVIAFIGSIASFALVRQRDFVPSYCPAPHRARAASAPRPRRHGDRHGDDRPGTRADRCRRVRPGDPGRAGQLGHHRGRPAPARRVGYAGVSMESVASEAGVARATIYRRYRDKADLITAAIAGNNSTHLAPGPSNDPRGDLISYLTEFDERFAESCLEVVGTLIGAREDPAALALHRQRVVEPRMGYLRSLLVTGRRAGRAPARCRPRPGPPDADRIGVRPTGGRAAVRRRGGRSGPSTRCGGRSGSGRDGPR